MSAPSDMNFRQQMQAEFEQGIGEAYSSDFGGALSALKAGRRVCRLGWNGKGMWLELHEPGAMSLPYIYMKTADDKLVPWLASQTDMLADDWHVLPRSDAKPEQPA